MPKKPILIIHGPNLNLLGQRETRIYGKTTLKKINLALGRLAKKQQRPIKIFFSNIEGELIDCIQENRRKISGLIINAAGYTHSSVALRDALSLVKAPIVEVHLSNIYAREPFRQKSLLSDKASAVICGFGARGYLFALEHLLCKSPL